MPGYQPRIAIIGGGPAGMALGLLLSRRGIRSTIYELRNEPTQEELVKPSGMLDLHEESGLALIRECGLWDEFQSFLGECSEATRVYNSDGNLVHSDEGQLSERPEISRNALTTLLLRHLPEDNIKWNHKITAVHSERNSATGATEITLDLGSNNTATYDFVVGADGAWSRVRNLLTDVKPLYSGVHFITATVRNVSKNYPHLLELNSTGTLIALGGGKGLLTHRGPQDSIRVYIAVKTQHDDWTVSAGLKGKTTSDIKKLLLSDDQLFQNWAPRLQDLLATACDEQTKDNPGEAEIWPLFILPVGHSWNHRAGVTLLGDAAHLMTPFAGEGVNLALWDSLDLAHELLSTPEAADAASWQAALEPKVRQYEEAMQARAQEKADESEKNKDMMMGENGAQAMADLFKMYGEMQAAGDRPEDK